MPGLSAAGVILPGPSATTLPSGVFLIDAYNLVHALGKVVGTGVNLGGLVRLIEAAGTRATGGQRVVLVCDGTGRGGGVGEEYTRVDAPIRVVFAGPGKDADSAIEKTLDHWVHVHGGRADGVTVVSSDKRVQAAALGCHAARVSSERFATAIVEAARAKGGASTAQDRPDIDSDAAEYWLREFGFQGRPREQAASPEDKKTKNDTSTSGAASEPVSQGEDQEWPEGIDPTDLDMRTWLKE